MAHKFIKAGFKEPYLKVVIEGKEVWASCTEAVRGFAKKAFTEGDDIEFEYEINDGKYTIAGKVTKVGGSPASSGGDTPTGSSEKSRSESPNEKQASIIRQTCAKATGPVMIALQGQINPNNVNEVWNTVYDNILKRVNE